MAIYQKVDFAPINDGQIPPKFKRKTQITEEDLQAAKMQAYQEGEQSVIAQAQMKSSESLRSIAHLMQMLIGKLQQEVNELNQDAVELALCAAHAISDEAVKQYEPEILNAYLKEAVSNLRNVPRILVQINSQIEPFVKDALVQTAKDAGFEGKIEVRGIENQIAGDVSIEWQGGAIRHNRAQTISEIKQKAQDFLASKESEGVQLDFFEP
jgi:flagellar assembly protein FliH